MQVIINQMMQLFLLISLGYALFKMKLLDEESNKSFTTLLLSVTSPALIISAVISTEVTASKDIVYFTFLLATILFVCMPIVAFIVLKLCRIPKCEMGLFLFMTVFSNIGFMGFPVLQSIFGIEAIFYGAIFNLMFNLFMFSIGKLMIGYGVESDIDFSLKSMLSPGVVASLIALFIYFTHIRFPIVIHDTIILVGSITAPIAMILIGSTLAMMPLKEVFNDWRIYVYTLVRQLFIPIVLYPLLKMCIDFELLLGVMFIVIAMPVGNSAILFATRYEVDVQLAAKTVFLTTFVSIFTIPLLVYMYLI